MNKVTISLLGVLTFLATISTVLFVFNVPNESSSHTCENRNEISRNNGECVPASSVLQGDLSILQDEIRVSPGTSGLKSRSGRYLHEIEGEMIVKYSLHNIDDSPVIISVHQTPLSDKLLSDNILSGSQEDFHYVGLISEDFGEFGEFVRLKPNETISRTFDLAPHVQVSITEGNTRLWLDFEMRVFSDDLSVVTGKLDMLETSKNQVEIVRILFPLPLSLHLLKSFRHSLPPRYEDNRL